MMVQNDTYSSRNRTWDFECASRPWLVTCGQSSLGHWAVNRSSQAASYQEGRRPSPTTTLHPSPFCPSLSGLSSTHDMRPSTPDDPIGFMQCDLPTCRLVGVSWAHLRQARLSKLRCLVGQMHYMHFPLTIFSTSDGSVGT